MAKTISDSRLLDVWADSGAVVQPDISKIDEGWVLAEQPPHEYMNWLQNTFGAKLNQILSRGAPDWNSETAWPVAALVNYDGRVWFALSANTNSQPSDVNSNWKTIDDAKSILYDNSISELVAENVQAAISELQDKKLEIADLATTTGASEDTAMTQKAVTDELDTRVKWVSGDKIITVAGSGADFTTVMGAVAEAMKWRSIDGSVIVEIQSGYLVKEQLFFIDNDYSHINIKAQNGATITVDPNSMSVADFEGSGASGFILCARGKSPMFQTQFEFLTRPADTINGALAIYNGEIYFGNNSGVKNAGRNGALGYFGGSVAIGNGNNFSGAGRNGALGYFGGSVAIGNGNNFSGAGRNGADGSEGGSVTMGDNNDFSGAGRDGAFGTQGGSVTIGAGNNFSGAGRDGAFGTQGGSVTIGAGNNFSGVGVNGATGTRGGSVTMGDNNDFSGVAVGNYSFNVGFNGFVRAGTGTVFTSGRWRSQARGTITNSGLIMG